MALVDTNLINQQINEDENKIPELVVELKRLLNEDGIPLPPNDELLIRFIRARKFNIERIHKSFKRYVFVKTKYREHNKGISPTTFKYIYDTNAITVFANRDKKGRQIFYARSRKWNPNEFELLEGLLAVYVVFEGMAAYRETQLNGMIIILDLKDLSFHQARQMTLHIINLVLDILQDTLPLSFQEIHIVNHPLIFNMIYTLAKPFIKEKLRNRLVFHGHNVKGIHKSLSRDILPYNLGGKLTNQEAWDQNFFPQLYANDEFYKSYVKYDGGLELNQDEILNSLDSTEESNNETPSKTKICSSA